MKHPEAWQPSKVIWVPRRNRYEANPAYVSLGSLFAVTLMAGRYEKVIRTHARGRLLDCGCGDVPYFGFYRDGVTEAVCVDWGESAHGRLHVDQEVNLTQPLPFPDGRFETVLLADVLEHIPVPAELMREVARVLSPGGKAIVLVPFMYRIHEEPYDFYRYTEYALERLASQAGLAMLEVEPYGGYPDVLMDLVNKGLKGSRPICRAFLAWARWVTGTGLYARWRERTKRGFPLGYCAVATKT